MARHLMIVLILAALSLNLTLVTGCANNAQTYGAVGATGGEVIGAVTGGLGGAVVGAAIGGGTATLLATKRTSSRQAQNPTYSRVPSQKCWLATVVSTWSLFR